MARAAPDRSKEQGMTQSNSCERTVGTFSDLGGVGRRTGKLGTGRKGFDVKDLGAT